MEQGLFETLESLRFLDIKLINVEDFLTLVVRYLFNLAVVVFIVRKIYYPIHRNKDYLFTFVIFNALVFFVCNLLMSVKLEMGFAFGLFALFSILRYRTITLPVKEMTYIFAVITVGVINAVSSKKVSYAELLTVNFMICAIIYYLDVLWLRKQLASKTLVYEKIENIRPENKAALIEDLRKRTGLDVQDASIDRINFMSDSARITLFYVRPESEGGISKSFSLNEQS